MLFPCECKEKIAGSKRRQSPSRRQPPLGFASILKKKSQGENEIFRINPEKKGYYIFYLVL